MEKNNWVSAINWVFFCPADYRECGGKNFTKNERFVEWLQYSQNYDTWDRVVFAWDKQTKNVIKVFQHHFRPSNYSGEMDVETFAILKALNEKYNKK